MYMYHYSCLYMYTLTHTQQYISLSTQCGVIKALVRGLLKCQVREGGRGGGREGGREERIRCSTVVMYMYSSHYRVQRSVRLLY